MTKAPTPISTDAKTPKPERKTTSQPAKEVTLVRAEDLPKGAFFR